MLKNISQLEALIKDKSVRLLADMDTDINIIECALKQFQNYIDLIREANIKRIESDEVPSKEEVVNE